MKFSLKQLVDMAPALGNVAAKPLPAIVSFRVSKVVSQIQLPVQNFTETREKRVRELGEKVDGQWRVTDHHEAAFRAEIEALLEVEIEITADQISVSKELTDRDGKQIDVAPIDLATIGRLLKD